MTFEGDEKMRERIELVRTAIMSLREKLEKKGKTGIRGIGVWGAWGCVGALDFITTGEISKIMSIRLREEVEAIMRIKESKAEKKRE